MNLYKSETYWIQLNEYVLNVNIDLHGDILIPISIFYSMDSKNSENFLCDIFNLIENVICTNTHYFDFSLQAYAPFKMNHLTSSSSSISTLIGKPLKLVDHFTYPGSNISSTKKCQHVPNRGGECYWQVISHMEVWPIW